jgi:hypothetical protein
MKAAATQAGTPLPVGPAGTPATHRGPGGRTYYPSFALGEFANYRDALAAIGFPPDDAAEWIAKNEGRVVTMAPRDAADVMALFRPIGSGGVEVAYLFGPGFADAEAAERVARDCAAEGWPEPCAASRWGVISRTPGTLQ